MMRNCPKCGAYYADPSLAFCFDDGTPLVSVNPGSEKWSEGDRVVKQQEHALRKQVRSLKWRRILMSAMTVSMVTIVVCVVALNGVFYFKPSVFPTPSATSSPSPSPTSSQSPIPSPSPEPSPSSSPSASPSPSSSPSASPSPSSSPSPSPVMVYKISGRVTSAGQPVRGIEILLTGSKNASATSAANGSYTFSELRAGGTYTVAPRAHLNFNPPSRSFNNLRRDESADFLMPQEVYRISGRVMSASRPLSGVKMLLEGSKLTSTTTDAGGNYSFGDLRAGGTYTITPRAHLNFTPASRSFNNLRRDESADFLMPQEVYRITGRVMSASRPLGGVKMLLEGSKLTSTTTDAGGNYSFGDLRAGGTYTITPRAQMIFNPPSRSFNNLRRDESADFVSLVKIEVTPTPTPTPDCSASEKERIGASLIAKFGGQWRRTIERDRSRIVMETFGQDVKTGVATLGPIEFQPAFIKCSAGFITARYAWQVKADLPQGLKIVTVPKTKRFACAKALGMWICN